MQKHIVLLNDKTIIELDFAKYCDLSVSRRSVICLCLRHRQIIDLLPTDKWRYFAQPRPVIVYYYVATRVQPKLGAISSNFIFKASKVTYMPVAQNPSVAMGFE